jgi:CheY-like chemotaxis protein
MSPTTSKSPVVLVVEDEILLRMDIADLLTDAGYRVIGEVNADHALAVLTVRSDVDVLFTDINMPGTLNGSALARIVDMRWPGIAIIVTSGAGRPAPGELPDTARFLPKPSPPSVLVETVKAALVASAQAAALVRRPAAEWTE